MDTRPITPVERRRLEAARPDAQRAEALTRAYAAAGLPVCGFAMVRFARIERILRTGQVPA